MGSRADREPDGKRPIISAKVSLKVGSRLGPYEILAPIGAGGMGEVYKASDTRLDRTVAVKVLPSGVSSSPDQRQLAIAVIDGFLLSGPLVLIVLPFLYCWWDPRGRLGRSREA